MSATMNLTTILPVSLAPVPSSLATGEVLEIEVTVQNTAKHPVTILKWDTPLDLRAGILGIFEARNPQDGSVIEGDIIRFSRKLPPPEEDFVEIGSQDNSTARIKLPTHDLLPGVEYLMEAKGQWKAVWDRSRRDVSQQDLDHLTQASKGDFKTSPVKVKRQ
ncbi:MAG: hypothetical protein Q9164_002150 [Protoblastenia rupestris]